MRYETSYNVNYIAANRTSKFWIRNPLWTTLYIQNKLIRSAPVYVKKPTKLNKSLARLKNLNKIQWLDSEVIPRLLKNFENWKNFKFILFKVKNDSWIRILSAFKCFTAEISSYKIFKLCKIISYLIQNLKILIKILLILKHYYTKICTNLSPVEKG